MSQVSNEELAANIASTIMDLLPMTTPFWDAIVSPEPNVLVFIGGGGMEPNQLRVTIAAEPQVPEIDLGDDEEEALG